MDEKYIKAAAKLRKELHKIPEASMNEEKTKAALIKFLKENTCLSVTDMGKWLYASYLYSDTAENLAFRADFDAVKTACGECAHLCGHDGHSAVLAAFGMFISENKPEMNIYLIIQEIARNVSNLRITRTPFCPQDWGTGG